MLIVIRCAPCVQRIRPRTAGDHPAQVGGVEEHLRADRVGDLADARDGMREQVQAAADGDERSDGLGGELAQRVDVDRVAVGDDRGGDGGQPVPAGRAGAVVGDVAADVRPAAR